MHPAVYKSRPLQTGSDTIEKVLKNLVAIFSPFVYNFSEIIIL